MSDTFDHEGDAWTDFERRLGYSGDDDEDDEFYGRDRGMHHPRTDLVCRHCCTKNLMWLNRGNKWGLQTREGVTHICPNTNNPEGFENVD